MRRRALLAGAGVAVVGTGGWFAFGSAPRAAAPAVPAASASTAAVTRGDVTQRVEVSGTLGFDRPFSVLNQLPAGILTGVAAGVVTRGHTLFAVAGTPAVLLYGNVPAYRDFAPGMTDGADVRQLEANLVALGVARSVTVDGHFSAATAAAIRRWRKRDTGTLRLGEVVFLPGAVRVDQVTVNPGAPVAPGTAILSGTSTTQVVTAQVNADQRYLVHVRDRVRVTLPSGGDPVDGTITRIGRVATTPPENGPPTVPVTVSLRLPSGSGDLDQAPVQVAVTVQVHRDVLMVPVTALLAKLGGGYQVRVAGGGLVDVRPGLYDDSAGTVEVAGALTEGTLVEVP
jgi:peptidoglycan hydrolase-like protein with peptidoglycan-binding domain